MSKYLFFYFLLLFACHKDNAVEIKTPTKPPPSTMDYFLLNYDAGKRNKPSFWEVIITSHESGAVTIKYKDNLTRLLFTSTIDTVVYLQESFYAEVGDTLWFSRSLKDDTNPLNRFDYDRRDQQAVLLKTTVK
jgi:hypothetical protein